MGHYTPLAPMDMVEEINPALKEPQSVDRALQAKEMAEYLAIDVCNNAQRLIHSIKQYRKSNGAMGLAVEALDVLTSQIHKQIREVKDELGLI